MNLQELKQKTPAELLNFAEELQIENASSLRKQDMMFAILKNLADNDQAIYGDGVLEVLQDGFGFLRSPEANYLPGPDDIYVSPSQVRRFGLRTGDTVEGQIRSPKDGERYFALLKATRAEVLTDMARTVKGEVVRSACAEPAVRDVQVAEMVIEKAKRLVEHKRDVVILLDSISRLARAYHTVVPSLGKVVTGGV